MSRPTPWIAGLLGLLSAPIGMLYVRRPWLALMFVAVGLAFGLADFVGVIEGGVRKPLMIAYWLAGPIVAFRCAQSAKDALRPWYGHWYSLAIIAVASFGGILAFRTFLYEPYKIPSAAMRPTLELNAHIVAEKRLGELHRGEIVVFDFPGDPNITFIKRLIGLPGDRIAYTGNKHVLVNGRDTSVRQLEDFLDEDALKYKQRYLNRIDGIDFEILVDEMAPFEHSGVWNFPMHEACVRSSEKVECLIPAGHYFVMGDNRDNSRDSRFWGFLRSDLVKGRVVKVFQ